MKTNLANTIRKISSWASPSNKRRSPANGSHTSSVGGVTSLILLISLTLAILIVNSTSVYATNSTLSMSIDNTTLSLLIPLCAITVADNVSATSASLGLSISGNTVSLNMTPTTTTGEFSSSSDITVGVNTTNNTGYKLSITANNCSGRAIFATLVSGDFRQFRSEENRQWFSVGNSVQTIDGAVNASEPVLPAWIA